MIGVEPIQSNTIKISWFQKLLLFLCLFLMPFWGQSQNAPKISSEIDTTSIKIGEQIQYKITVETDSTDLVHFPEGQTFSPLETVEALMIDTTKNKNRVILQRIYALTQFDSGAYTIPPQRIAVNEQPFYTDSFRIKVADVVVDTTTQKMYDIKPLIQVEKSYAKLWTILLWVLLALLVVGGLVYWFFLRKKPLTEEEMEALLPPYDRALLELKKLENSRYLIQDEFKKYYSELTDIVRSYLEEDVQVSALESTTSELITKLELLRDAGELDLQDETISQFQKILQTADLVKFAKSKPAISLAEQDRKLVEQIVVKTHDALPDPTDEELLQNEEYLEELAKKKQRKRIYWAAAIFAGLIFLGGGLSIAYFGFKEVRDTVFGYPTKDLLEGEWVGSSYGYPPIELETPDVLIRQEAKLPPEAEELIKELQTFSYGSYVGVFSVATSSVTYKEEIDPNFEAAIGGIIATFEGAGVKNIITKQEEFVTKSGVKGLKTFGTGNFNTALDNDSKKAKYNILTFGGKGFMQQIVITWEDGDDYAEEIVTRILNSLDVKTQV
ncbi:MULTISPECIES: BatD family protein [Flavobacteriaceae]|uniref:BatD family protein n=1 Tax=Flavobacteriaceae TaxID=49546 RepID=UPI0014921EDA|nr:MULTISPECIES: BatD family protein [Allomuricauda]MDC6365286.1 BatD family protein [Muricauda sp. AC10]